MLAVRAAIIAGLLCPLGASPARAAASLEAAWVDQAPYPAVAPDRATEYVVRLRNTGQLSWDRRDPARTVVLGIPGDDPAYAAVGMAAGWLSPTRVAGPLEEVVAPGKIGTFVFGLRAVGAPGTYRIPLRPVVESVGWLHDDRIYVDLTVVATGEGADPLTRALDEAVGSHVGEAGVVVIDPGSGYRYEHDAQRPFAGASLYKLEVLVALYERADEHREVLTASVEEGRSWPGNRAVPVREAIEDMITVSDNDAAYALTELVGADAVNERMRALGLTATWIDPSTLGARNTTTALDQARLLEAILANEAGTPQDCGEMRAVLLRQRINDRISTGLPAGTAFAHKTGNTGHTYHDAGIVSTPYGARIVVVLTEGPVADLALMRDIGQAVYWLPAGPGYGVASTTAFGRSLPGPTR